MATEEVITTRLHISGLTPSITPKDLQARFSSFGTVQSLDGLGLLDGLGQPRKFAYLTLQTTPPKLKRLLSVLSGTTYKGAKLRIGEALPDYRQQWEKEKDDARKEEGERGKKRRRLGRVEGREAADLDEPVTVETAKEKPYWHVTPLQHLIRPVRMRPPHPLPPPLASAPLPSKSKPTAANSSKKKQKDAPPLKRARRAVIDPRQWGPTHLGEELLGAMEGAILPDRPVRQRVMVEEQEAAEEQPPQEGKKKGVRKAVDDVVHSVELMSLDTTPSEREKPHPSVGRENVPISPAAVEDDILASFTAERTAGMDLLKQMFGHDLEKADEMVYDDSDVELPEEERRRKRDVSGDAVVVEGVVIEEEEEQEEESEQEERSEEESDEEEDEEEDEEAVPPASLPVTAEEVDEEEGEEEEEDEDTPAPQEAATAEQAPRSPPAKEKVETLKDLFVPREDVGGFTLGLELGLEDLDLEAEPEPLPLSTTALAQHLQPGRPSSSAFPPQHQPQGAHRPPGAAADKTDYSAYPLFFPVWDEEGKPVENHLTLGGRRRAGTFWDLAREKGWGEGWGKETEAEARDRWERTKYELTQDWRKRAREARRNKRGRGLGGAGAGAGEV